MDLSSRCGSPADRLALAGQALVRADARARDASPELAGDFAQLAVTFAEHEAAILVELEVPDAADGAFRRALDRGRHADDLVPGGRAYRRALARYADWLARSNADAALRRVLPILHDETSHDPDADSLGLQILMIRLHDRFGDGFQAAHLAADLRRDLDALGFAESRSGDYRDVLGDWIDAANRLSPQPVERYRLLSRALLAHFCLHASRAQSPAGSDDDRHRMDALASLQGELPAEAPTPPIPEGPDLSRLAALVDRFASEGATPEVQEAARALWDDEEESPENRVQGGLILATAALDPDTADVALDLCSRIEAFAVDHGLADALVEARTKKSIALVLQGDFTCASEMTGLAIDQVEAMRRSISSPHLASAFMTHHRTLYALGINAARRAGKPGTMLARMEKMKARNLRLPTPGGAEQRRSIVELGSALRDPALEPDGRRRLEDRRRAAWEQLVLSHTAPAEEDFDPAALQERLRDGTALLSYFFLDDTVLLIALIDAADIRVERVEVEVEGPFYRALEIVLGATSRTEGLHWDLAALARVLLPATFESDIDGATQLIVCPHQALHGVPFAALPWRGEPLIVGRPVGCVPHLSCLLRDPPPRHSGGLVAVATRHAPTGAPLSGVEAGALAAADSWQRAGRATTMLLHDELTREAFLAPAFRQSLAQARAVHVGLHGEDVASADLVEAPMECRLFLADGPLDGLDLATLDLTAEVVVLSVCYAAKRAVSARGQARLPDDAVFGLQAALYRAGAQAVLGALWPANDKASPRLTLPLHQALAQGATAAQALRRSLLEYRRRAEPPWAQTSFWACFTLIGFSPAPFGLTIPKRSTP